MFSDKEKGEWGVFRPKKIWAVVSPIEEGKLGSEPAYISQEKNSYQKKVNLKLFLGRRVTHLISHERDREKGLSVTADLSIACREKKK